MNTNEIPVMQGINELQREFPFMSRYHLRTLVNTGKVKAVRIGRKILINRQSLIDYLNSNTLGVGE